MGSLTTRAKPKRSLDTQSSRWQQRKKRWNGLFVTLEGGEGAGKSSLIHHLRDVLISEGFDTLCTREPGGTPLGEYIREWLLAPHPGIQVEARAELCLFLAARAQHIEEVILPALKAGKIVLCDRFNDSTIAYQGIGRGLGLQHVQQLCALVCDGVTPDLTFYLDVSPEIGLQRITKGSRGQSLDRIERQDLDFHLRIRKAFLEIAQRDRQRVHVVDAHRAPEEVFDAVFAIVQQHLSKHIPPCS